VKEQLAEAKQDAWVQTSRAEQAEKAFTAERLVKADKAYRRFLRERNAKLNAL
jgi:hypothetical protein